MITSPSISNGGANTLTLYDSTSGTITLDQLLNARVFSNVSVVSKQDSGSDYTTIQGALDALPASGGIIFIYGGVYAETLTVNKPLHLIGVGDVSIEATDTTAISAVDANLTLENIS